MTTGEQVRGVQLDEASFAAACAVWARYARTNAGGVPIRCGESRKERGNSMLWRWGGNEDKVIYDTQANAEAAAPELAAIYGHAEPQRAYPCPRSRSGHFHLTSDPKERRD